MVNHQFVYDLGGRLLDRRQLRDWNNPHELEFRSVPTSGDQVVINGGVVNLPDSPTFGSLLLNAGTMNWVSGTLGHYYGGDVITIAQGSVLNISGTGYKVLSGGGTVLNNSGTIRVADGAAIRFNRYNGVVAILNNSAGALIDFQGADDGGFFLGGSEYHFDNGGGTLNNAGTLRKSSGSGAAIVHSSIAVNNTGLIEAQSGALSIGQLNNNGTTHALVNTVLSISGNKHRNLRRSRECHVESERRCPSTLLRPSPASG